MRTLESLTMKDLTQNQQEVLAILRHRGADFTARATEEHWRKGESYYLDTRNSAGRGIIRKFKQGNREARGEL